VETQFLLMELDWAAEDGSDSTAAPCYGLLLPLIDGGRFRATLRPPRRVGVSGGWVQHGVLDGSGPLRHPIGSSCTLLRML
jgi:hypothetical protein